MEIDAQHLALFVMAALLAVGLIVATVVFRRNARRVVEVAAELAAKTSASDAHLDSQLEDIHMLVNSRLDEALDRIVLLEKRLGVDPGQ